VVILGATNRRDIIDPALLRPGRFDLIMEMPVPNREGRLAIFRIHTAGKPLAKDVNLNVLVEASDGMVGADIEAVCRQASMLAIREFIEKYQTDRGHLGESPVGSAEDVTRFQIAQRHFDKALAEQGGRLR